MKPTQVTELLATIKKTFVSFFSILMFVALGVGVFLGISWEGPALQNAADDMFRAGLFHHFQIQYLYGLTDDDLAKLAQIDGITKVEAERQSFQTLEIDGNNYTVKVQSLGQEIDIPIVREGVLPDELGEIALHAASAKELGLGVGDTITFERDADTGSAADSAALIGATGDGQAYNENGMTYLKVGAFKITAIIDTADYIAESSATYGFSKSPSGAVNALAWVPDDTFDASAFRQGYPIVNLTCESLSALGTFSDDYKTASGVIGDRITGLGETLAAARFNDLHGQLEAKVADGEKQLAAGKQKITDGEKQLADGRAELETKKTEGEQKLADGYQQLLEGERLRADGEAQLASARWQVEQGEAALAVADDAIAQLDAATHEASAFLDTENAKLQSGEITQEQYDNDLDAYGASVEARIAQFAAMASVSVPPINHTNFGNVVSIARSVIDGYEDVVVTYNGQTMTVGEARTKLDNARAQLSSAEYAYYQRVAQLNAGWAEYYAGQEELDRLVAEGEQKIADGERELADAKAQVAENEPKVTKGREQIDAMKSLAWSVVPRSYNAGVGEASTFSSVTNRLSISMAALFIVVGLLVSYFAVSRLVHEQITQIGTKKALGFRKAEITKSFLLYSGVAVVAGAIIGAIVGYLLVEGIIGNALAGMFAFGAYPPYFGWVLFIIMTVLELVLILGATYLACRGILKRHAVELLRGERPPVGKERFYERWGVWDRLPLFVQTIVNNCVNDKRRMLSTIVGVAGSTALIVTAITLNNDVLKSYDYQYDNVYGFNDIAFVESEPKDAADGLVKAMDEKGVSATKVSMKNYLMEVPDGNSAAMRIIVPFDEDSFRRLYHVNPIAGSPLDLSREGAWVSQALAEHFGAKVGDTVAVVDSDGKEHKVPILGFYEFWLTYHEMVVGPDYFKKEFGDATANAVIAQSGAMSMEDLRNAVSGAAGFDSISDDAVYQHGNFEMFSSVSSAVVAIYLILAALMAVVVLLNLNVMFIEEKKRELIVLMINGFSVKDAKHYISYDSVVLTALGIVAGVVLGCIMGSITVMAIEPSTGVFVKSVDAWAVLIGIVGSAILAIIMNVIALRRIPKFNLTDINKQ